MRARGITLVAAWLLGFASAIAQPAPDGKRSGFDTMGPRIQAMQRDRLQNPGMWSPTARCVNKIFGITFSWRIAMATPRK
jgi:hypothetical protein